MEINTEQEPQITNKIKNLSYIYKLSRDMDDSSDEEKLKSKNKPLDYNKALASDFREQKIPDFPLAYLVHILSNRLLYSSKVNDLYYPKKNVLAKFKDEKNDKIVEKLLGDILNRIINQSKQFLRTSEGQPLNKIDIEYLNSNILEKIINIVIPLLDNNENLQLKTGQELKTDLVNFIIKNLKDFLPKKLVEEMQERKFIFRTPEEIASINDPSKLISLKFNQGDICNIAIDSIKTRLNPDGTMPNQGSALRENSFQTPYKNLAKKTWNVLRSNKARANCFASNYLSPNNGLTYISKAYVLDILSNDPTNIPGTWEEVKYNYKLRDSKIRIVDYFPLDNKYFSELVNIDIELFTQACINNYFDSQRPTLGSSYGFFSNNVIEFLANLRLAHRSLQREDKNLQSNQLAKEIYIGSNPKKFQFQWHFFKDSNLPALETRSLHGKTFLRSAVVENISTYEGIYVEICNLKKVLGDQDVVCNDSIIALWIREVLKGVFLANNKEKIPSEILDNLLDRLSAITYLLFGCEVSRNPASLIIHQMILDLIMSKDNVKISWHQALGAEQNTPLIPMAAKFSIDRGRAINDLFAKRKAQIFAYRYDATFSTMEIDTLIDSESKVIKLWLKSKQYERTDDLNILAKLISGSFSDWFGGDIFSKEEFILSVQEPADEAKESKLASIL